MGEHVEATSRHTHRTGRFEHLDMIRGLAALLVLVGHVRGFVFIDYSDLTGTKLAAAPLYVIGGLGHQAVILFFALSGFLVGGRAMREIRQGRWNLPDYAVHRFARLWTALIPALIATALLDWIGRDLLRLNGYGAEYWDILSSGPFPGSDPTPTLTSFLGNIAFLQTIAVPVFGTNGPLWSLANEFWYYFLVPFAWMALAGRNISVVARMFSALFAIVVLILLPFPIIALGSIWVIGATAWSLGDVVRALSPGRFLLLVAAIALAIAIGGVASLARPSLPTDILLGLACAATLPCLARLNNPGGFYGRLSFWLSEISFTLYVVHFPLIALLWFALLAPVQFGIVPLAFAAAAGLIVAAIGFAAAMWWLFERNTGRIRALFLQVLHITKR
ncbi:acyltransferase family protein [Sphingomonas sp. ERG5]|uniref:acyltransferase family protein n=1 Tax=Sphingomonas sp. ERG5 TaxID=1381597 RepID=UPI0006917C4F|nr:acyltransferase [Sphingomonas sp. ERG5]